MNPARSALVSVGVGVLVFALKLLAWRVTGSVALYSDALESTVNVVAALAAFWALKVASRPADDGHPWGHSKAEYFSAVLEGVLIAVAALSIFRAAASRLMDPQPLEGLGLGTLFSVLASGLNGALGLYLLRRGRQLSSPALKADGLHVLSDVVTTGGVLLGIGLASLTGLWILDPILACVVALLLVRVGYRLMKDSFDALMDSTVPASELERLKALVVGATDGAGLIHSLRARHAGRQLFVEVRVGLPPQMSVLEAHELCDRIESVVEEDTPGAHTFVHVEPA